MSDSVFMGCPILAQVGRLTGDTKYFDMCVRHMRFMLKLNLRTDGLHRHSPLDETAWGRGNGFPALGLALALEDMPTDHPGRAEMLVAFQSHLKALLPHQDVTGAWHQVIDHPESYRELTSTCMITYAMIRGVKNGWLDKPTYEPAIDKAWTAIKSRVASDGTLVDVCTGTGKMKSLREYLDRTAILGRDPRGGAMALLIATEKGVGSRQ
jgi:rhamnogalacturonyl hydrolase YesR